MSNPDEVTCWVHCLFQFRFILTNVLLLCSSLLILGKLGTTLSTNLVHYIQNTKRL
jgi:hypothetical protein